ncbi:ankyrin repeat-containing domain protein, partial [Zopfochytrium polystomum]
MLKDASGATCLFLATAAGQIEVVKLLLDGMPTGTSKAQLSSSNREFRTPLHVAAGYNQVDIARILLEKGADVHAVEANKMTPLGVASQMGSTDVALLLLNNEPPADPSAIDWSHRNPLHIACETRKLEFARMLLDADKPWSDKLNPNAVDLQKRTPLIIAVFQHDAAMVALLLGTGRCQFNYRRPSNYGDTALSIAAATGLTDILQLLLEAGADTEPLDMGYRTPIINASIQNHPEAIGLLMKAGANINHYPNGDGFNGTAIYYAAYNNFRVAAEILLSDPSIDLELPYSDGTTPLLAAAMRGNGDIVDILLK